MKNERVILRLLMEKDAERMLEWLHNDDIIRYLRFEGKNTTFESVIHFIQKAQNEMENLHYAIVDIKDEYLGTISLKKIDKEKKSAEYAICLHPNAVGTGTAKTATQHILDIAFNKLNLENVYLNVLDENKRAIQFYEKFGFQYTHISSEIIKEQFKSIRWYEINRKTLAS